MIHAKPLSLDTATAVKPEIKASRSLVCPSPRYRVSNALPVGAQAKLIRAAQFSQKIGYPLNSLLTVNAAHLQRLDSGGVFGVGHLWDGLQDFLELTRKWVVGRGVPWVVIWCREYAGGKHNQSGEHWHIGQYLAPGMPVDFAEQVARWTDAPIGDTRGENAIARSTCRSWHLRKNAPAGYGPEVLAAYLGKAEPSWVRRHGKLVPNKRKPDRRKNGGTGPIEGKRFHVCKTIGATEQDRATVKGSEQRHQPAHSFSANIHTEATQSAV